MTTKVVRVFGSTLLILIVSFSALLTLAAQAGIFGLPLAVILLSWFGKYLFVIIDTLAHGHEEPPVLSIEMVAPLDNWRGLALAAIVGTVWAISYWLESTLGEVAALLSRMAGVLALPAAVAIIAIESNPIKALNPRAVARVVVGLGPWYLILLGGCAIATLCVFLLIRIDLWLIVRTAAHLTLIVALAALLGTALFERRAQLGIEAWRSPERTAERTARELDREHARFLDEVFALARNRSHANAWRAIEQRLTLTHHADAEYDWLLEGLQRLEDPRYVERMRNQYLERLIAVRRSADGLRVLERIWRVAPEFRPRDAAATLTLARVALDSGTQRVARVLLGDFAVRFAGHPSIAVAQAMQSSLTTRG